MIVRINARSLPVVLICQLLPFFRSQKAPLPQEKHIFDRSSYQTCSQERGVHSDHCRNSQNLKEYFEKYLLFRLERTAEICQLISFLQSILLREQDVAHLVICHICFCAIILFVHVHDRQAFMKRAH